MVLESDLAYGMQSERSMLKTSITVMRVMIGVFFILSGIANYLHFSEPGGFFETITQSKLRLWGWGFEGVGPLPALFALPYAYLLPASQLVVGTLFVVNRLVRWAGFVIMLMLFSFIMAFGLIGPNGLIPSNQANWDKNTFMLVGAWICASYDRYKMNRQQKAEQLQR